MQESKAKEEFENLILCDHPLVSHNLTIIRDKNSSAELFRNATKRIARFLMVEATKNLPLRTVDVETPLQKTQGNVIVSERNIIIAPILRAALILSQTLEDLLPHARVHHLGLYRNEKTLEPVSYYNKIPKNLENIDDTIVYVIDPMLATGGSAIAAVQVFINHGIAEENITFVSLISSPEGIRNFRSNFAKVKIVTGVIDEKLNDKGYIIPGLGDAGDRTFNTIY